jgi:hypothetical protein
MVKKVDGRNVRRKFMRMGKVFCVADIRSAKNVIMMMIKEEKIGCGSPTLHNYCA